MIDPTPLPFQVAIVKISHAYQQMLVPTALIPPPVEQVHDGFREKKQAELNPGANVRTYSIQSLFPSAINSVASRVYRFVVGGSREKVVGPLKTLKSSRGYDNN